MAEREMTLDEWVDRLPDFHAAHKEYDNLCAEVARLTQERDDAKADYLRRHQDAADNFDRAIAAEAEVARLREQRDAGTHSSTYWSERAIAAEAEVARLKVAAEKFHRAVGEAYEGIDPHTMELGLALHNAGVDLRAALKGEGDDRT